MENNYPNNNETENYVQNNFTDTSDQNNTTANNGTQNTDTDDARRYGNAYSGYTQYNGNNYNGYNQSQSFYGNGNYNGNAYNYNNIRQNSNINKPKKQHPFAKKLAKAAAIAAVFGIVSGAAFQGVSTVSSKLNKNSSSLSSAAVITTSNEKVSSIFDVSEIVKNVMPAMVAIDVVATQTVQNSFSFYGFNIPYQQQVSGSGTGIIISKTDSSLFIATNYHIIDGANTINVTFTDNTSVKATVKGSEEEADLAVIEVKLSDLDKETLDVIKVAVLGDSDKVQLGEPAIAIGNALGNGQSVTVGHISTLAKEVQLTDKTMTLLQTDAAINPGNSGGALINSSGEVIGINSVKYASTDVEGIGYAIPITDATPIITALMNGTAVPESQKPYLGISGTDVTEQYQERFGLPKGVYISSVFENSPAEKAGIKAYDIITSFDGKEIETMSELTDALAEKKAGDTVSVTVKRHSNNTYNETTVTVTLGSVSNAPKSNSSNNSSNSNGFDYGFNFGFGN